MAQISTHAGVLLEENDDKNLILYLDKREIYDGITTSEKLQMQLIQARAYVYDFFNAMCNKEHPGPSWSL